MPVGINSPARNLFLLGSSGQAAVTNFFETIDQSAGTDGAYLPREIKYIFSNQKYALAGTAQDSNSTEFGWFERQDYDLDTGSLTTDYTTRIESTQGFDTTLSAMELDSNDNLIVVGKTGDIPWIAKYSNAGVLDWQSTTNSADVEYYDVVSDSNGQYYACGHSPIQANDSIAFVEKFDASGNPGWGKSAFMLGSDVRLKVIECNSRGEVVAGGRLEDETRTKAYLVKIDTNTGEVLWDRTIESLREDSSGNPENTTVRDVYIDNRDQIYVVGRITTIGTTNKSFIIKYSPEGNIIWQKETEQDIEYYQVKSDGETEQTVVFGIYQDTVGGSEGGVLSKYSKDGSLVWRRTLFSSNNNSSTFGVKGTVSLDADPSFYYLLFTDGPFSGLNGTPDSYTFGQVSSSGNGLGGFQYAEGTGETIDYEILSIGDSIGRLSDGSVRNDSSDLITYPFTGNKIVFDDLSTQVTNKKRQMDDADSFEYSGSPAIRPADFQELNLLGDVYSGSGDWLDQSGKGNDATTSFTTSAEEPFSGAGSVEFDGIGQAVSVPAGSDFAYGTGDFTIEGWFYPTVIGQVTGASASNHTFFAQTVGGSNYLLFGVDANGKIYYVQLNTGGNATNLFSSAPNGSVVLNQWQHIALCRNSGTLRVFVDGALIDSVSHTFDYTNTTYNPTIGNYTHTFNTQPFNGYVSNFRILKGTGLYTSNFTVPTQSLTAVPNTVLLTCQGNTITDASSSAHTITVSGGAAAAVGDTNTVAYNAAGGYFEFDGTNDYIQLVTNSDLTFAGDFSYETWLWTDVQPASNHIWSLPNGQTFQFTTLNSQQELIYYSTETANQSFGPLANNTWGHYVITKSGNTITGYLNGVQAWTSTPGSSVTHDFSGVSIGRRTIDANPFYWDGRMGEIRIYPRALTAAQVFQNYNATKETYTGVAASTNPGLTSTRTP